MTFLEALYGSQYSEIKQSGKDGAKGRFNGNIFLSAFIFLCLLTILSSVSHFSKAFSASAEHFFSSQAGNMNGKTMGKLLAIPVFAIIYLIVSKTVGNEQNFILYVERFLKYPEAERKKANSKILIPFFIILVLFVSLTFSSL